MAKVNNREVKEQCNRMNDAWVEGAKAVEFNGIKQTDFAADIADAANDDAEIADLEAQLNMKRDVRDQKYVALNVKRSNVGKGVSGNPGLRRRFAALRRDGLCPQIRPRFGFDAQDETAC